MNGCALIGGASLTFLLLFILTLSGRSWVYMTFGACLELQHKYALYGVGYMQCIFEYENVPSELSGNECLLIFLRHGESYGNRYGVMSGQTDVPLTERGILQAEAAAKALREYNIDAVYSSDLRRAYMTAALHADIHNLVHNVEPGFRELHVGDWECRHKDDARERYGELYGHYFKDGFALYDFRGKFSRLIPLSTPVDSELIYRSSQFASSVYRDPEDGRDNPYTSISEALRAAGDIPISHERLLSERPSLDTYKPEYETSFPVFSGIGESVIGAGIRFAKTAMSVAENNLGKRVLVGTHAGVLRSFFSLLLGIAPKDAGRLVPFAINASFSYVLYRGGRLIPLAYSDYSHLGDVGFLASTVSGTPASV